MGKVPLAFHVVVDHHAGMPSDDLQRSCIVGEVVYDCVSILSKLSTLPPWISVSLVGAALLVVVGSLTKLTTGR